MKLPTPQTIICLSMGQHVLNMKISEGQCAFSVLSVWVTIGPSLQNKLLKTHKDS